MADDRVEPRLGLVGSGAGTTPERLADIERRAREIEQAGRAKPTRPFEAVMAERQATAPPPPESEKEKKRRALPKRGPRPSLLHPAQRDAYGREEGPQEPVVLKG